MGDMGDYWHDVKPFLKDRRHQHVRKMGQSALNNITELGYPFEHYENNHQFAVKTSIGVIDYWGTTGTWIDRKTKKRGRGLKSLRKYLEERK